MLLEQGSTPPHRDPKQVHYTGYTLYIIYIVRCIHCALYTLFIIHMGTLYTLYIVYIVHIVYYIHCTLYTLYIRYTIHLYTVSRTDCYLRPMLPFCTGARRPGLHWVCFLGASLVHLRRACKRRQLRSIAQLKQARDAGHEISRIRNHSEALCL